MTEGPEGWAETTLGEVGSLRLGKMLDRTKNQGDLVPYLRNVNVRWFAFDLTDVQELRVSQQEREVLTVQDGDVFICEGGEPGRAAVWRGGNNALVYQKALHRFRPSPAVLPELVAYRLKHDAFTGQLSEAFTGTTIKHLPGEKLSAYALPLPPLPEQIRIADKLDALLARVDAGRERLERVPKLVKQLRQAVLGAAVSGELTREWRGGAEAEWERVTVGDCIESLRNGISLKPTEHLPGVPILKISSVRPFSVKTEAGRFVPISQHEANTFNLTRHDLLVTRYNGSLDLVGVAGMVTTPELEGFTYPDKLMRVRVNTSVLPAFLEVVINAPASRIVIEGAAKTTSGQTGISGKDLKELSLLRPPLPEQAEIVRRVEALFAIADRLEQRYQLALSSFERLTPALLAKAFRGELVPQDPTDEPASTLLERLRAQQAAGGAQSGRGRKARAASTRGGGLFEEGT